MPNQALSLALWAVVALRAGAFVAVALVRGTGDRQGDGATPGTSARLAATVPLDVSLDRNGRAYDVELPAGARVARKRLTTLHAPSARVIITGGEYVGHLQPGDEEALQLAERPDRAYPIEIVWLSHRNGIGSPTVAGVVIRERDTPVVRWRELEQLGYGTDGGVGGITTPEWASTRQGLVNEITRLYDRELVERGHDLFTADADGSPGIDTIVFGNGSGDGAFPAIGGYDASGARAVIVVWHFTVPWRVAFPHGRPPAKVIERERELADCLAGKRTIAGFRGCRVSSRAAR